MRLALFQPDIPQNLGAAIRLAACFDTPLDIIEPCGFPLTDKAIRRAAMDYGALAQIQTFANWQLFHDHCRAEHRRIILLSAHAQFTIEHFAYCATDVLLLGRESAGVPDDVRQVADAQIRIELAAGARSLNVVVAGAIALFEARRQTRCGPKPIRHASI